MKKIFFVLVIFLLFSGCKKYDTLPANENSNISPVRLINVDGTLYYDTGLLSRVTARCGTLDGNLKKAVSEFEVPKESGEANFIVENKNYFGYQYATSISCELPLNEEWRVFKKINKNITEYKYAYFIEGRHPKASDNSKYIVFANTMDITFEAITKYLFSSLLKDHLKDFAVLIPDNPDEWGILMYADNITDTKISVFIEQFGGNFKGELSTGSSYTLEVLKDEKWQEVPTKSGKPLVWNSAARMIKYNEINEFEIDFSFAYNKLEKGNYRIGKEIMDWVEAGNFSEKTYYAEFKIE